MSGAFKSSFIFIPALLLGMLVPTRQSTPTGGARIPAAIAKSEFGFKQLSDLAQRRDVTSIETLLPLLPEDLRSNFTLVAKSQSRLQTSTPENPRAILFGSTGKLILTFNGNASETGFSKIEVLSFGNNKFELHELEFENARVKISETNPHRCTLCHDENPRPIWFEYRNWHGAMGAEDDEIGTSTEWYNNNGYKGLTSAEFVEFDNFRTSALNHPRYQWLGWKKDDAAFPYHLHNWPSLKSFKDSPNTRLTELNVLNLARAIGERVTKSTNFPAFKYSLARGMICDSDAETVLERLAPYASIPSEERWVGTKQEWIDDVKRQHAILNFFGIPYGSTSTALRLDNPGDLGIRRHSRSLVENDSPMTSQPVRGAFVLTGFPSGLGNQYRDSHSFVAVQLLLTLAKNDAYLTRQLQGHTGWTAFLENVGDYDSLYDAPEGFARYFDETQAVVSKKLNNPLCAYLRDRSEKEFAHTPATVRDNIPQTLSEKAQHILIKSKCVSCHAKDGLNSAPAIPFLDRAAFKIYAQKSAEMNIDAIKQIRSALWKAKDQAQSDMPVAGAALRPEEIEIVIEYFSQAVGK